MYATKIRIPPPTHTAGSIDKGCFMRAEIRFVLAMALSILAILCFIAGQSRFAILPSTYANFLGITLVLISAIFWSLYGTARKRGD